MTDHGGRVRDAGVEDGPARSDAAARRQARFGALPGRVQPADMVGLVETDVARDLPDTGMSREQRDALLGGG